MTERRPAGRYGTLAMTLHWGLTLFVVIALAGPLGVEKSMEDPVRAARATAHASMGATILFFMLFRLGWRLRHPVARPRGPAAWEIAFSYALQYLLYLAVIIQGCLGLAIALTHTGQIELFWAFNLYSIGAELPWSYQDVLPIHSANMRVLMVLIGLHISLMLFYFLKAPGSYVIRMLPKWMNRF